MSDELEIYLIFEEVNEKKAPLERFEDSLLDMSAADKFNFYMKQYEDDNEK